MKRVIGYACLLLAIGIARCSIAQANDQTEIDLVLKSTNDGTGHVEARWYPPQFLHRFLVKITDSTTGKTRSIEVEKTDHIVIDEIDSNRAYTVSVVGLSQGGHDVASSQVEQWQTEPDMPALETAFARANSLALDARLLALDSNNFPFIFTTLSVSKDGQPVANLTQANFTALEDGRLQTDFFQVTPPQTGGNVRIVDFIFIIDNSGSMSDEQQQVKTNVKAFVDSLQARKVNYRLGLVRFGQTSFGGQPILMNNGVLTGDINFFKNLLDQMTSQGGTEPGIEAVYQAAIRFTFRPGSQRHFLLITDEDSDGGSLAQAIATCQQNNIIVHTAVDCGFGAASRDYCGTGSIRAATGGQLFNVIGPYRDILDILQSTIGNTYIVRYRSDNPAFDGKQREVRISITASGQFKQVIGYYTPGAAPIIQRTQATINLSNSAQVAGVSLTIAASITDQVAPFVQAARVFMRTTGTSTYSVITMSAIGGSQYTVTIPGSSVQPPGLDYYITATDGQVTSSDPAVDPDRFPFQIAVLPNLPPRIVHTSVTSANVGADVLISAAITDNTNFLSRADLFYRPVGTLVYQGLGMIPTGASNYQATIPGVAVTSAGVEYFIRAVDDFGLSSVHGIHVITTTPTGCNQSFSDDFEDGNADGWRPNDPTKWSVQREQGNFAYCQVVPSTNGDEYTLLPSQWSDFVMEVRARSTGTSNKGYFVLWGVQDPSNGPADSYYLRVLPAGVDLFRSVAGRGSIVASDNSDFVSDNQYHRVKVERLLPTIKVFIDGQFLFQVNDPTFAVGNVGFGVRKNTGCFDDFQITSSNCPAQTTLTIPAGLRVPSSGTLSVPIVVSAQDEIGLAQFTVEYDGDALRFASATVGPNVTGFTVEELTTSPPFPPTSPGVDKNLSVQISGSGTATFTGSNKTVLILYFTAVGRAGDTSPLYIDRECDHTFLTTEGLVDLCGNQLTFQDGGAIIIAGTGIDGRVLYYSSSRPVRNARIDLVGPQQAFQVTDSNSAYKFTNISPGNYTLTPSKNGDQRGAIKGSDALLVMRALAFLETLSPDQLQAADVTRDGALTGADVVAILRYLVFFTSNIAQTGKWAFKPPRTSISLSGNATQDFTAFLLGDPTGDWGASSTALAKFQAGEPLLRVVSGTAAPNREVMIPVVLSAGDQEVHAISFSLSYNADFLRLKSVQSDSALHSYQVAINDLTPGRLYFAAVGLEALTGKQTLLHCRFGVAQSSRPTVDEALIPITLSGTTANDRFAQAFDGGVMVRSGSASISEVPQDFILGQNYPNPFNMGTQITYGVPKSDGALAQVKITVYNLSGQKVRALVNEQLSPGMHNVFWDANDDNGRTVSSGLYVYVLRSGETTLGRRLLLLK